MSGQEELAGALRDELRRLAYAEAPAILSQARERALARARETLEQALYEELLAAVERVAPNPSSAASELAEPVRGGTARAETAEVAWYSTHHHTPEGLNEPYGYSYLFAYPIDLPAGTKTVTLPNDDKIRILAISVEEGNPAVRSAQPPIW